MALLTQPHKIMARGVISVASPPYPMPRKLLVERVLHVGEKIWLHSNMFSVTLAPAKINACITSLFVSCRSHHALMFNT
jgi:hypothetical protein